MACGLAFPSPPSLAPRRLPSGSLAYFPRPLFFFGGRGLASLAISARALSTSPRVGTGISYPLAVFWVLEDLGMGIREG
jgi:hypothetical protein